MNRSTYLLRSLAGLVMLLWHFAPAQESVSQGTRVIFTATTEDGTASVGRFVGGTGNVAETDGKGRAALTFVADTGGVIQGTKIRIQMHSPGVVKPAEVLLRID